MTDLRRAAALVLIAVVGAGCAGCGGTSSPAAGSPSSAGSSATSPSPAADVPPPPQVGQCRNAPADLHQWVDNTPVVDCSRTHTLETVAVIEPAVELTLPLVRQLVASCETPAVQYLGISFPAVRTIDDQVVTWPSRAQRAAGQSWVRCDAGVREPTYCCGHLVPRTGSLRGAVAEDPVRFRMCLDQLPRPDQEQPMTSCRKPHRTEVLPTPLQMDVSQYPSAATLTAKGRSGCARLVARRPDRASLVVTSSWQSKASWGGGATLYGWCWVHRGTGLLPPVR